MSHIRRRFENHTVEKKRSTTRGVVLQFVFSVEIVDQLVPLYLRADLILGEFGNPKLVCLGETVLLNIIVGGLGGHVENARNTLDVSLMVYRKRYLPS